MMDRIKQLDQTLSIIIPTRNDRPFLLKLLTKLSELPIECLELLIIDSSDTKQSLPDDFKSLFNKKSYEVKHIFSEASSPGASRNEGVNFAQGDWLGFLDTKTIPNLLWVDSCKEIILNNQFNGLWGNTKYLGNSLYENIIIASTYGFKELITVPGMVIKREVFFQVGNFLPSLLAGEDTDWIIRLKQHQISLQLPTSKTIDYYGIAELNLFKIIKKWFQNYRACRSVAHLKDHRIIYLAFFNIFILLLVFNWNSAFANWDINSEFFIPNISKITATIIFAVYFLFRAILLPLLRGCSVKFLLSGNFILIFGLGAIIDCIKFIAFFPSFKSLKTSLQRILHRAQI
ncbi:glycosyltransferase family 2 protein [Gammaproteobacteria bacterium]|nr:glycosyltransferase family 2 protein [Gammaproteobacteria bacterium]